MRRENRIREEARITQADHLARHSQDDFDQLYFSPHNSETPRLEAKREQRERDSIRQIPERDLGEAHSAEAASPLQNNDEETHPLIENLLANPRFLEEQAYIWQQLQYQRLADTIQRSRQEQRLLRETQASSSFISTSSKSNSAPPSRGPIPRSRSSSSNPTPTASTSLSASARTSNSTRSPRPQTFVPSQRESRSRSFDAGVSPSTFPHPNSDAEERQHSRNESANDQQDHFLREQGLNDPDPEMRSVSTSLSRGNNDTVKVFKRHARLWSQLAQKSELTWNDFPWPMMEAPASPDDISLAMISAYMHSQCWPSKRQSSSKNRIKDHLKKWHPDRFETVYLIKVAESEREKVKWGAENVAQYLSDLLRENSGSSDLSGSNDYNVSGVPSRVLLNASQEPSEVAFQTQSSVDTLSPNEMVTVIRQHERLWSQLSQKSNLTWEDFPWPMAIPPTTPDDISPAAIWAYLHSPCWLETTTYKDRIKDHMEKWRLETFEAKYLINVAQNERVKVIRGQGNVLRHLSKFSRQQNIGSLENRSFGELEGNGVEEGTTSEREIIIARELQILKKEEEIRRREQELHIKENNARRQSEDTYRLEEEFKWKNEEARLLTEAAWGMSEELKKKESELTRTKSKLAQKELELAKRDSELAGKESDLEAREKAMVQREQDVKKIVDDAKKLELAAQQKEIETKNLIKQREERLKQDYAKAERIRQEARTLVQQATEKNDKLLQFEEDLLAREKSIQRREEKARRVDSSTEGVISMQLPITCTSTRPASILSSNISLSEQEQFFQEYQQFSVSNEPPSKSLSTKSSLLSVTDMEEFYQEELQPRSDLSQLHSNMQLSDGHSSNFWGQSVGSSHRDTATPRPRYIGAPPPRSLPSGGYETKNGAYAPLAALLMTSANKKAGE